MPTPPPAIPALAPIVHLTTVHTRRDVRIFHKEAQTLRALGRPVILVVADGLGDEQDPGGVRFVDVGPLKRRLTRAVVGSWRAMKAVIALQPAVVHFHDPEIIPMALVLKALGYTIIYDVHEDVPRQILDKHWIPRPLRWTVSKAVAAIERVAKFSFDAFATATPHIASKFPASRTVVVQNYPIPEELVTPLAESYPERPLQIAYVGGTTRERGGCEMVNAMAITSEPRPTARLAWAGTFAPTSFEAHLRSLPGWANVDYRGKVDRPGVAELLGKSRAGLVVFQPAPNHMEAQPNKLFEYMAAGLPVIASDFPLWRNIVTQAGCGLLVDPLNPSAIADAITWIFDHPDEAEAMGRRGQTAVTSTYTWDREAEKLLALYTKLLVPSRS